MYICVKEINDNILRFLICQLALDIENEAYEHNRLLDGMGNDFSGSEGLMSGSINRVKNLLSSGRSNRKAMCYMAGFVVIFLFLFWYLISKAFSSST